MAGDSKSDSAVARLKMEHRLVCDAALMGRWRNRVIVGTIPKPRPQQPVGHNPRPRGKRFLAQAAYFDNFVHTTFCDSVRNTRGHNLPFDYWTMVRHTAVLMQQLCVVVIFSTVFRLALIEDAESGRATRPTSRCPHSCTLMPLSSFSSMLFTQFVQAGAPHAKRTPHMLAEPQRLLLFLVLLMAVTCTAHAHKDDASDTIYLLAVLLGTVHVFSYDFTYMLNMSREFKGTVSMNAALLCSILLASRLSSNLHCFGLMCFAVELFSLSPILWHMLRMYSTNVHAAFTAAMVVSVSVLLALTHRRIFGFLFVFAAVVIPFVAPLVFLRVQRFKVRIAGPGTWAGQSREDK